MFGIAVLTGAGCVDPQKPNGSVAPGMPSDGSIPVKDLVIYELFVTDFTDEGTFRAIIPRLSELKHLGVNTIWLMPIHPIGVERRKGELGSPYSIRDHYEVNPDYGTKQDFEALVKAVHDEGMYIIIDFVANHTSWDHGWVEDHPEWYTEGPAGRPTDPLNDEGESIGWTDVADLDYSNPELRAEMMNVLRYWVEEYDIDGYRCDVAGMVPFSFWEEAIPDLRAIKPIFMLAEWDDPAIHDVGFDATYAWPFYRKLKEVFNGGEVSELIELVEEELLLLPEGAYRLRFITNHDETAWDAPPPVLFGSQDGAFAAAVVAYTLPGLPLMYNGQEIGTGFNVSFFEKTDYNWDLRSDVRARYKSLLEVRRSSDALRSGRLQFLDTEADQVLMIRRSSARDTVLVAVNTSAVPVSITYPAPFTGRPVKDVLNGQEIELPVHSELSAYGYRLVALD